MERRTEEPVCPPASDPAHLTAASCCTAAERNHPSCCRVRNARYNPDDPACVAKSAALPATFSYGVSLGDRQLRGGDCEHIYFVIFFLKAALRLHSCVRALPPPFSAPR
jgi:hypothetical protein